MIEAHEVTSAGQVTLLGSLHDGESDSENAQSSYLSLVDIDNILTLQIQYGLWRKCPSYVKKGQESLRFTFIIMSNISAKLKVYTNKCIDLEY